MRRSCSSSPLHNSPLPLTDNSIHPPDLLLFTHSNVITPLSPFQTNQPFIRHKDALAIHISHRSPWSDHKLWRIESYFENCSWGVELLGPFYFEGTLRGNDSCQLKWPNQSQAVGCSTAVFWSSGSTEENTSNNSRRIGVNKRYNGKEKWE